MAVAVKKLNLRIGDVVEIDGRRYDVLPDHEGGIALEPAITKTVAELRAERGSRPLSREESRALLGDLPFDDEG